MINEHDPSRMDAAIDAVVGEMVRIEPRRDVTNRVLRALERPQPTNWFVWRPAFPAAALAVLVLIGAVALLRSPAETVNLPSIPIASGPPSLDDSTSLAAAVRSPAISEATTSARSTRPAARSSEDIFGRPAGKVSAASVRAPGRVRVTFRLKHDATPAESHEGLTVLLVPGEQRSARSTGPDALAIDARGEILPSGSITLVVQVNQPVERHLRLTLVPGKATPIANGTDASGRPFTLEATAIVVRSPTPQR